MGAARVRRRRPRDEEDDGDLAAVIFTSSDDEEANRDLTLEIVERARRRMEAKGAALTGARIEEDVAGAVGDGAKKKKRKEKGSMKKVDSDVEDEVERYERKRKKKRKERKDEVQEPEDNAKVVVSTALKEDRVKLEDTVQEELVGSPDSEVTEVYNAADNMDLQKLLRGPRYFDTQVCDWKSCCFNCGEEGHAAVNCTEERRQKPCFVCGAFGHKAKDCLQGQDCFVCKRRGHAAKDCPKRRQKGVVDPKFCLQCADYGHDMFSCRNSYSLEDLQEIQCYVCKQFGHLCCVEFHDSDPIEVSCYNCGQCGHVGVGCCKRQMRKIKVKSPSQVESPSLLCHACGEEGHFARGCTKRIKPKKLTDETSTPSRKPKKHTDMTGSKSAPPYLSRPHRRNIRCDWAGDSGSARGKKIDAKVFRSSPMGAHRQSCKWFPPESVTGDNRRGSMGGYSPSARCKKFETNKSHKPHSLGPPSGSHKHFPTD